MSFGTDTPFLLYFGENKNICDINKADILYGEDKKTCVVKTVLRNTQDMVYRIKSPYFKEVFIGESNTLALYDESAGRMTSINVCEYEEKDKYWKRRMKAVLLPLNYETEPTKNDPYMVGLIIGCSRPDNNDAKAHILELMKKYTARRIEKINEMVHNIAISPTIDLEELTNIYTYRFIPKEYIYNSTAIRISLIEGVISHFLPSKEPEKNPRIGNIPRQRSKSSIRYDSSTIDLHEMKKRPSINFATYAEEIRPLTASTRGRKKETVFGSNSSLDDSDAYFRSSAGVRSLENTKMLDNRYAIGINDARRPKLDFGRLDTRNANDRVQRSDSTASLSSNRSSRNMTEKKKLNINVKSAKSQQNNIGAADPLTPSKKIPKIYETIIEITDETLAEQVIFILRSLGQKTTYSKPKITISGILGKGGKVYCDFDVEKIGVEHVCRITTEPTNAKIILGNTLLTYTS
jgi:hypothetical protein